MIMFEHENSLLGSITTILKYVARVVFFRIALRRVPFLRFPEYGDVIRK